MVNINYKDLRQGAVVFFKKQSFRQEKRSFLFVELSGSFAELLTLRLHGNGADVRQGKTVTVEARLDPSVAKTQINKYPETKLHQWHHCFLHPGEFSGGVPTPGSILRPSRTLSELQEEQCFSQVTITRAVCYVS